MTEKKSSGFRKFYVVFLIVLFVLVIIALAAVWFTLKNYQDEVKTVNTDEWIESQSAFEAYVDKMSYGSWTDLWFESNPESLDSRGDVLAAMEQMLSSGVSYARAKNYTDEAPVYVVENEEGSIAEFTMAKDAAGKWQVVSARMRQEGKESARIMVPSGTAVFCNGVELDDSYCIGSESVFPFEADYGSDLVDPVLVQTWEVTGQAEPPVLSAEAPAGTEILEENGSPVLSVNVSANSDIKDCARKFFDAFFKYGMYGYFDLQANADAAAHLCRKDSQAYRYVYTTQNAFQNAPCWSVYVFNSLIESPMIKWAENAYTIDFTYDVEATYRGTEKNYVNGTYRILVMDLGDGFEVCGIMNH